MTMNGGRFWVFALAVLAALIAMTIGGK